jgi:hypothetical protein
MFPPQTIRTSSGRGVHRVALLITDLNGSTEP